MSISFDSLYARILVHAPGAGEPLIQTYIKDTLAEFTQAMPLWDFDSGDVTYPGLAAFLALAVPTGTRVSQLRTVRIAGVPRDPGTADDRRAFEQGRLDGGAPVPFYQHPNRLVLLPTPAEDTTVRVFASLQYDDQGDDIPDFLTEHEKVIADGVLAVLLDIPNRPWSDPLKAGRCRTAYEGALSAEKIRQSTGRSTTPIRRRPRFG